MTRSAAPAAVPAPDEVLGLILTSRVYEVARETPTDRADRLSRRLGVSVWLREDLQPVLLAA